MAKRSAPPFSSGLVVCAGSVRRRELRLSRCRELLPGAIANLVEGLKSTDPAIQEKALAETEKRLCDEEASEEEECKTKVNRTAINTRPSGMENVETVNSDGFLAVLEKDARERAKRRKRNEHLANALKEKGNDAFRKGDYVTAIQKYTEGLEKLKDKQELYTNRAQAYMKMHEYEKAIGDCEWALKCNEKCIKAYFQMGKAHLALKHFSESRQCYQKILEIDPRKESLFKNCMNELNLEEKRMNEEERALKEFQSGGIKVLTGAIRDCTEQTLFRTNDGFSIINDNKVIRQGFCAERKDAAEVELSVSLVFLWQAVCTGNEENQRLLLTHPDMNVQLSKLLSSGVPEIQKETLALISLYSETENGRRLLVRHQDLTKWLQVLMMFVNSPDARASRAMNILTDLTKEENFKTQCRMKFSTDVLPLFSQLLTSAKLVNWTALAHCIGIMGDLCADVVMRKQMADCQECWQACLKLVDECLGGSAPKYHECLFAVLGLIMNLLLESNEAIQYFAVDVSRRCMPLLSSKDGRIVTRAIGVLSRILPASSLAIEEVVKGGVVKKMIKFLKAGGQITSSYAVKTLCICTKSNSQAQEEVVKSDKSASRNEEHGSELLDQNFPGEAQLRAESSPVTSEVLSITEDNLDEVTFDFQTPAVDSTTEVTADFIPVQTEEAAKLSAVVPKGLARHLGGAYQLQKEAAALKFQDGGTFPSRLLSSPGLPISRQGSQSTRHQEQPSKSLPGKPERENNTEPSIKPPSSGAGLPQPSHSGGMRQDSLEFAAVFSIPAIKQTEVPSPKMSLLTSTVNFHTPRKEAAGSPFSSTVKMALESARVDWLPTLTPSASKRLKDTNVEGQPDSKAGVTPASLKKIQIVDARVTTPAFFQKPASGNLDAVYSRMMQSTAVQFSPTFSLKEETTDSKARNSKAAEMKGSRSPSQLPALQTLPQGNVHSSLLMPLETLVNSVLIQSSFQGPRKTTDRSQSFSLSQTLNCTKHVSQGTKSSSQSGVLVLQGDANHQTITRKPETAGSPSANSFPLSQSQMSELKFSQTTRERGVTPAFFPGTSTFVNAGLQPLSTFDSVHAGHQPPATSAPVYAGLQLRGVSTSAKEGFHVQISSAFTSSGSQIQATSTHPGSQETFPMKLHMSTVKDSKGKTSLSHQIDKAGSPELGPQASTTSSPPGLYDDSNQKVSLHGFISSASQNQQPGSLESFPPKLALLHTQGRQPSSTTAHPEPVVPSGSHEILAHVAQALVQQSGMLDDTAAKNLSDFRVNQLTVLPSSQYLSFLLRNSNGIMCLQPMQDSALPTGFPNTSIGTLVSIQQMLAASNSSALDLVNLKNLNLSSLILVKPVFILLPTETPEFQIPRSPEGEDDHKTVLSFTNKQDLNLVTPESSHNIPMKTSSSYSTSKPLRPETTLSAASNQSVEKIEVISQPVVINTNSTASTSLFQAVTSISNHLLHPLTRVSTTVQATHLHGLPEEIQLSAPYSQDSRETDILLLNGGFAEPLTSAVPPLVLSTQHSPSLSPKVFFTAEKPSSSVISLLSAKRLPASGTPAQPLFTVGRTVDHCQHSIKLMLQTTSLHQGVVTTSSSINTQRTSCLNLRSAGTIKHPLKMSTNIVPLQSASQSVPSMASLQRLPAQVQFVPSTLPAFSALSPGNNYNDSAAGSSARSGGVTAHATVVQTPTTSIKPHLTKHLVFTPTVPKSFVVTERPTVAPVLDPFLTKVQAKTAVSGKLLAAVTHTGIHAKSPASLPSSVSTDAPLPSALKYEQTSLAPTKLLSRTSVGENAKPTQISTSARKIGASALLGTSVSLPAMFNTRTQQPSAAVLGSKVALTLVQPSVPAGSVALEREPKLTPSTLQSPSATTFLFTAKNDHTTASVTKKKVFLLPVSTIRSDPYMVLPTAAKVNKATVVSPSIGKSDGVLMKEEYSAATGRLPIQAPVFSSHQASASLQSHPLEKILLVDNTEQQPGHSNPDTGFMQVTGSSTTKVVNKVIYQSPDLNAVAVNDAEMLLNQFLPSPQSPSYSSRILVALTPERNSLPDVMNTGQSEKPFLNAETEEMFKTNEVTEEAAEGLVTVLTLLDSEPRLLLSESRQRSVLQSDDVLLNGHAVVTDVCGSDNYTVQMSLRPAREASSEVRGSLLSQETFLALITLQSNSSHPVLQIRSCCVTPTTMPEGPDATCCLFHRLPSECRHIQLLQSSQSRAASFAIQVFQMLNHSVAYLHCELNVCLHGKTGCEQDCFESVEMLPPPSDRNSYGNLHNLISFGPILRTKNRFLYKPVEGPDSAMLVPVLLGSLTGFAVLGGAFLSLWLHHRRSTKNLGYPPLGEIQGL
ncbi:tetratricopeptide repeat protein 12 isoform X4 [Dromaius novaehollandiae]|uniref:tetratricopeptide repeat protein 12 isoform X4 n=1 Tax=Dromaius novaehollandiae TaxID=8790 RepID=UPI0031203482